VPTPEYILAIRSTFGHGRLLLPGVNAVVVRTDLQPGRTHVLLTRRSDTGLWALPAGIVEPGEQPAATILRELVEETRVVAVADRLALLTADPELTYPNGDVCQFISTTFRCRYVSGEAVVGDEESTAVAWFPVDDLPADLSALQHRRIAAGLTESGECIFDV
jgi:ADP-ribose pyrophosphatase YjhB (NUDIX family)